MSKWFDRTTDHFRRSAWPELDEDARGRIETFAADVLRFGRSRNLVSRVDPGGEVARLVEESVLAGALLRWGSWSRLLDIGSGAGFPGIVFASLFPLHSVVLVERRQGRCDFLERSVARLDLGRASVVSGDVRTAGVGTFDRVTGKAVTEVSRFLGWCDDLLVEDGAALLFQRTEWEGASGWQIVDVKGTLGVPDVRGSRVAVLVRRSRSRG